MKFMRTKLLEKKWLNKSKMTRTVEYIHIFKRNAQFLKVINDIFLTMYLEDYTFSL